MEKEVKELFEYMKQEKNKLQKLEKGLFELKSERDGFTDENSAFYKQAKQAYDDKYKEYDSYRKQVGDGIKAKKAKALEVYAKKMEKIDKINARLNEKYDKIKSTREKMEGKKAQLKWLESTLPVEGKNNEDNRIKLETLREDIENMGIEIRSLGTEAIANQEILAELVPENKKPSEFYKELQEESKSIKNVDFMNLDETEKIFETKRADPKKEPKKDPKADPKADPQYTVIINAENGLASFFEERDGMSIKGQFKLDDIFKQPKKIRKEALKYMNDKINGSGFKLKFKEFKKLNPAILKVLMEAEQPQLLYNYITAIKNKSDLPFAYDADLKNPESISKKTLYRLNNQLIRDNKDLSTDFNVEKNLRLKNALSKLHKFNGIKALPGKVKQSFKNGKETVDTAKDLKKKGKNTVENIAKNIETKYGHMNANEVKQKTNSDTNVKLQAPENLSDKLKKEFPPIQPKIALTRLADQQIQQRIQQQGIENDEHVQ